MNNNTGTIRAICISTQRGTVKHEVETAVLIEGHGIENDAHAGNWHRQISLLSGSKIDEFNSRGAGVSCGDFGENLIIDGIDIRELPIGSVLSIRDTNEQADKTSGDGRDRCACLKLTQKGKECHTHCQIYQRMGECIMPSEGVFAEVISGGVIRKGDMVEAEYPDPDRPFAAAVITLSDILTGDPLFAESVRISGNNSLCIIGRFPVFYHVLIIGAVLHKNRFHRSR